MTLLNTGRLTRAGVAGRWALFACVTSLAAACSHAPAIMTVKPPLLQAAPPPAPPPPEPPAMSPVGGAPPPASLELPAWPATVARTDYSLVPVYYATDRALVVANSRVRFGPGRGELHYGKAVITVPAGHVPGEIEQPRLMRLLFAADPARNFTQQSSELLSPDHFSADLGATIRRSRRHALLVFVHGYNVSFRDALFRTAQIKFDVMPAGGAALMFSWPSAATLSGYMRDEDNAQWSIRQLAQALRRAIRASGDGDIYLIAHSMGNRVLTNALLELRATSPDLTAHIKEVILAAPDIDADLFRRDIAPRLRSAGVRTTLYASSRDEALVASRRVHGNSRLGDTRAGVPVIPPIETIDATTASTDLLGHSYIGQDRSILNDVATLIATGHGAAARGIKERVVADGRYWEMARP